jgi:predicted permease
MENLWNDIRYGVRMFAKNPGFSAIAVVVLALGIGANTAIFGLVNSFLLRPIVAENPHELMGCHNKSTAPPGSYRRISYPNYKDLRETNTVFTDLLAHDMTMVGLTEGEDTRRIFAVFISSNYFDVFGVGLFRGRGFRPEEEVPGSAVPVVIVSYLYWKENGEDPDLVGKTIQVNGQTLTIVGITPRNFTGRIAVTSPELYLPFGMHHVLRTDIPYDRRNLGERDAHILLLVGRLRRGMTTDEADSRVGIVAARLAEAYPAVNKDYTFIVHPPSRLSVGSGPEVDDDVVLVAVLFMAMTGIVLLIACINLANMLLARGAARRKEFAIRIAIGGGRGRILRQLLTEGLLLSLMGGLAGLLVAYWADSLLAASMNQLLTMSNTSIDLLIHAAPDHRVLLATMLFCALGTLLFGLGPAWRQSRPDVITDLKDQVGEPQDNVRRRGALAGRNLLVVSQIALSLALLTAAGLFIRGAFKAVRVDPGFDMDSGLVVEIDPGLVGYDETRSRQLYQRLLTCLRNIPGIESAGLASTVPFGNTSNGRSVRRAEDRPVPTDNGREEIVTVGANYFVIGDDYFRALGVPIMRGREFTRTETESAGGPRVAIINDQLARRLWPDEDPLGRRIGFGRKPTDRGANDMEVVGIVPTLLDDLPGFSRQRNVYVPHGQNYQAGMHIHLRTSADEAPTLQAVRREIRAVDEQLPILKLKTLETHMEGSSSIWLFRTGANVLSVFGALALFMAVIGIYGVKAYTVVRRTREIGIRTALGASARDTVWMILREGLYLTLAGTALGLLLAAGLARLLSSMLFDVSALDPLTFSVAALVLATVSVVATYIPARRAARVNPITALRHE